MTQNKRRQKFTKKFFLLNFIEELFRSSPYGYGISRYLAGRYFFKYLGEADFEFFKFISKNDNDYLFLDIGANDGISALTFRIYNQNYRIISFEPDTKHNKSLERVKKKIKKFEYFNVGLGDQEEKKVLYIPESNGVYIGQLASFLKSEAVNNVPKIISKKNIIDNIRIIEKFIEVRTLDSYNFKPEIIKVDVEGFEDKVLEGAKNTISSYKPFLMIEVNETSFLRVSSLLNVLNYEMFVYDKKIKKISKFKINDQLNDYVINLICVHIDRKKEIINLILND